jgi:alkylhydroperoxidase family enzyme
MRLEPIDRPASFLGRLITFAMRWRLGKEITPARVIYNRVPRMWNVSWALLRLQMQGLRLDPELRCLVQLRAATLNRCEFCQDIAKALAVQQHIGLEKFRDLDRWETSSAFSDRERALLAFVDEATRQKTVSDAVFAELRKHYGEREVVEITVLNAIENFYNLLNIPLGIESDRLLEIAQAKAGRAG